MRLYFILLICIRACVNAENDEPTIISSEAEELLNFLVEIHEEFCGNSTRCRDNLNHTKQPDGVMFPEACCLPCSCSHTCRSRRNCCPEYLIQDYNQSTVLEHISIPFTQATSEPSPLGPQTTLTRQMLEMGNNHPTLPVEQNPAGRMLVPTKYPFLHSNNGSNDNHDSKRDIQSNIDKTVLTNYSARTVCVKPQVVSHTHIHSNSQSYEMVVSCPISFPDMKTKSKCNGEFDNEYLYDTIPVTSSNTGITYANKHCLMCNELYTFQNASFSPWQVLLAYKSSIYVSLIFNDISQSFKHPLEWKLSYYGNIHFVPPNISLAKICQKFDITKCNQTGLWDIYDRKVELLCEFGINLPVFHRITDRPLVFRNSACLNCNTPKADLKNRRLSCSEEPSGTPLYKMTINTQFSDGSRSAMPDTHNVSWLKQNSSECPRGYVNIMDHCKKLLCPRGYYRDLDACVPLYGIISGLTLHLKLEIIPNQAINTTLRPEFAEALKSKIKGTIERLSSMSVLDSSLWHRKKSKKNPEEYYMYNVYFFDPSNKLEFGLAINSTQNVLNTLRRESSITFRNGHSVQLQYGFGHKVKISKLSLIDTGLQTYGLLFPLMDSDWRLEVHNPSMTISDSNWCDRIALSFNEFKVFSRDAGKIKWTNTIVYSDQYDITEDLFVLLCVELFKDIIDSYQKQPDVILDTVVITQENKSTTENHWAVTKQGILTWSALGVILVCVVLYRTKTIIHKRFGERA